MPYDGSAPLRRVEGAAAVATAIQFGLDPLRAMRRAHQRYGALAELTFRWPNGKLGSRYIHAVGAKYNERVLRDPAVFDTCGILLPGPRDSAQRRIRRGLLTVKGAHHAHYRKLMTPPLRRAAVDQRAAKMREVVEREIEAWPLHKPINLYPLIQNLAMHVALETLFATDGDSLLEESLRAVNLMGEHLRMDGSLAVKGCPVNVPGLPYERMLRHAEEVERALAAWARAGEGRCHAESLLAILARAPDETGAPPAEATIAGHLLTMFGASYETSQSGLAWALLLLALHPDATAKLLDEIEATEDDDPAEQRTWLDGVVKESLRLMPPVPLQIRRATRDADLVDCDVARGTFVVLSTLLTNRDPELYAQPNRFRPERWADLAPTQYEYLVFSAGPRYCIGAWFATTFLKIAISSIARKYRLEMAPNARVGYKVGVTLAPEGSSFAATFFPQDRQLEAGTIRGNVMELIEV